MVEYICPNCPNHCKVTYELYQGTIVNMQGCPCPKGMMTLLAGLLPMNQKKSADDSADQPSLKEI
ncbi:MAG: hypothetical protein IIV70_00690 [Peptococcaceae bacterium]|nr:hypothetical protein [Peptococcaceae bacterium]